MAAIKRKTRRAKRVLDAGSPLSKPIKHEECPVRFSAAAKIVMFSAFAYLGTVIIYLIFQNITGFTPPQKVLGISFSSVMLGAEIFVFALSMSIATRLFLANPINRIKEAIRDVSRGDFLARAASEGRDEFGALAAEFNQMLNRLEEFNAEKMKTEHELLLANEELKYKSRLEKRGRELKETNRALEYMVKDFSLLYEIGQSVNSTIDISELYRILQDVLPGRIGLQKFALLLVDEKKEFLNIKAAYGFESTERIYDLAFRIGEGISGEAAMKGELIYVPDVEKEPRFLHYRGESVEKGAFLSIPLRFKKDILGVMNCSRHEKGGFTGEDIRFLTLVANQIAMAVENAQLHAKTRELSVRDELTGIYNRRHFQEVLQMEWKRATRFKRPLSLLMIDIDHFKLFNDAYGHIHGDRVLKTVAGLLLKNLREVDTICRFGGEEFVVLLPDTDIIGAGVVGEKIRRMVEREGLSGDAKNTMPLTISIGISSFPKDAREMDDLIDHADVVLYEAKDRGRNQVLSFAEFTEADGLPENPAMTN